MKTKMMAKILCLSFLSTVALAAEGPAIERVGSTNKVGLDFIREAIKVDAKESGTFHNTMISPISAYTALAMLHGGLRQQTKTNLDTFLAVPATASAEFDSQNLALLNALRIQKLPDSEQPRHGPKSPVLGISNSAWSTNGATSRQPFAFTPDFTNSLQKNYAAETAALDFLNPKAADVVNSWANTNTNGMIPKVISSRVLSMLDWLLMNATYLEASWAMKFTALKALEAPVFSLLNGEQIAVDMINGRGDINYVAGANYQGVELPFFGADLSFFALIPNTTQDFTAWMNGDSFFTQDNWNSILASFSQASTERRDFVVHLKMPKFSFAYSKMMRKNDPLTLSLGLDFLFRPENKSDFAPLGGIIGAAPGTVVGLIKQDTMIVLDENGVKAAAVTVIGGGHTAVRPPRSVKEVVADKPFAFAIASKGTGAILFIGTVVDPR